MTPRLDLTELEVTPSSAEDLWPSLDAGERLLIFNRLSPDDRDEFFLNLSPHGQASLLAQLPASQRKGWMRILAPDDAADVLQELPVEDRVTFLQLLDGAMQMEVSALLAYEEDHAGGLMNPRFARLRPEMDVGEAVRYLQRQSHHQVETIYYCYVLGSQQELLGICSFRDLFRAPQAKKVAEIMETHPVTVHETTPQDEVARMMQQKGLLALPVINDDGCLQGIVTLDDIVDVVQEEATEDAQKFGGMEALDSPYLQTSFFQMLKKRAGWLMILFVGEMLTASAMGQFEDEIAKAVVLALFIPLIISSGGNSGSQASTLIIRAMALGEVRIRDWWQVAKRELASGLMLGLILASIGVVRIVVWQGLFASYGDHYGLIAITVGLSLIGVVVWGTLLGSMLPFLLRRVGFDPASASAPFVATLVDVSGLIIYFKIGHYVLSGTLL